MTEIAQRIQTRKLPSTRKLTFLLVFLAAALPALAQDVKNSSDEKSYIDEHSAEVPALFRPALGDHLHCSVFRQLLQEPTRFGESGGKSGRGIRRSDPVGEQRASGLSRSRGVSLQP